MKQGILAIFDSDLEYTKQLADYWNRKEELLWQIQSFTSIQALNDYIKKEKVDLLLLEKLWVEQLVERENSKLILLLTDEKEEIIVKERNCVYKFQSADILLKEIIQFYKNESDTKENFEEERGETQLYGLFSFGICKETTEFGISLAHEWSKTEPVLYITLDVFSTLQVRLHNNSLGGLSDLIYYLKQEEIEFHQFLPEIIKTAEGFDYIAPVKHFLDLQDLTQADLEKLLKVLSHYKYYSKILIEFHEITLLSFWVMQQCKNWILLLDQSNFITERRNLLYSMLESKEETMVQNKVKEYYFDTEDINDFLLQDN